MSEHNVIEDGNGEKLQNVSQMSEAKSGIEQEIRDESQMTEVTHEINDMDNADDFVILNEACRVEKVINCYYSMVYVMLDIEIILD